MCMMLSANNAYWHQAKRKETPSIPNRFLSTKTDRYIILGTLGIGFIFLGIFVLIIGLSLITYSGHLEQGIPGIVLGLVLFAASIFMILLSTKKIKLPNY